MPRKHTRGQNKNRDMTEINKDRDLTQADKSRLEQNSKHLFCALSCGTPWRPTKERLTRIISDMMSMVSMYEEMQPISYVDLLSIAKQRPHKITTPMSTITLPCFPGTPITCKIGMGYKAHVWVSKVPSKPTSGQDLRKCLNNLLHSVRPKRSKVKNGVSTTCEEWCANLVIFMLTSSKVRCILLPW